MAFESESDQRKRRENKTVSGDIMISTDAAVKNHKEFKTTVSEELTLYIVHGILHLLGYDDHSKKDILKMRKKEKELMSELGNKAQKTLLATGSMR